MKTKTGALWAILIISVNIAFAQTGVLSGKVVDAKTGETLIGATVLVDGNTSMGAATDMDGNFTIAKIPEIGRAHV